MDGITELSTVEVDILEKPIVWREADPDPTHYPERVSCVLLDRARSRIPVYLHTSFFLPKTIALILGTLLQGTLLTEHP